MRQLNNSAVLESYKIVIEAIDETVSEGIEKLKENGFRDNEDVWHYVIEGIEGEFTNKVRANLRRYNHNEPSYIRDFMMIAGEVFYLLQEGKANEVSNESIVNSIKQRIVFLSGGEIRVWVNVYHIERVYGGAEEGGWWYNVNPLQEAHNVTYDEAQAMVKKMQDEHGEGEGNIYSVLGGHEVDIQIEGYRGQSEDVARQHYS